MIISLAWFGHIVRSVMCPLTIEFASYRSASLFLFTMNMWILARERMAPLSPGSDGKH